MRSSGSIIAIAMRATQRVRTHPGGGQPQPAAFMRSPGLAFSLLYRVPGFQLGRVSDLAFGFFCGFGLTHYYLDSRIWRVRHDPGRSGRLLQLCITPKVGALPADSALPHGDRGACLCARGRGVDAARVLSVHDGDAVALPRRAAMAGGAAGDLSRAGRLLRGGARAVPACAISSRTWCRSCTGRRCSCCCSPRTASSSRWRSR